MIDNIFGKKIEKIIDYMFVFYMIILFCFDSNEFGVHLVQLTMYIMMILLLVKIYREKKIVYNRPILFLGIFTFFCAITSVFALDPKLAIGRSINIFVKLLFVFLLYNNYHDGKRQKFLVNTFIGAGVVLVLYLIKCYGVFDFFINIFKGKRIYAGVPNNELLLGFPNINTISTPNLQKEKNNHEKYYLNKKDHINDTFRAKTPGPNFFNYYYQRYRRTEDLKKDSKKMQFDKSYDYNYYENNNIYNNIKQKGINGKIIFGDDPLNFSSEYNSMQDYARKVMLRKIINKEKMK